MDPISSIKPYKDSSFAMLLAAQARAWSIYYIEPNKLSLRQDRPYAQMQAITVKDNKQDWYQLDAVETRPLDELDIILMRKDPPVDDLYINCTQILDMAMLRGVSVLNNPSSLRDANEKLFALQFPQCIPQTLVSAQQNELLSFIEAERDVILKPLNAMGGRGVFRVKHGDGNNNVIIETLTEQNTRLIMAQRFIPEISAGDKRILMVYGRAVPYALARIPAAGENRGNIAAGGTGVGIPLSERDYWICDQVAPELIRRGLMFVGLDVIGDYLTEINVTSPTCIRELDKFYQLDIAGSFMDGIAMSLSARANR